MKFLRTFSCLFIGTMFIFSGVTKAIDPIGTGFVIAEYLKALGLQFFTPLSVAGGMAQSMVELLLGVALILGVRMRLTTLFSMAIMVFFTFFTFWVAMVNPVRHCGCFGDAIILTNWETFYKNLIFTPFTIFLFFQRKHFRTLASPLIEWSTLALFGVACIALSCYCYRHLPLVDFTGFRVGNDIPQAMTVPDDAPKHQYKTTLTYQKGKETKTFTMDNLPDSTWTFVDMDTRLVKMGALPQIPTFEVSSYQSGRYITDSLLSIRGPLLLFIVPHVDKAHPKAFEKAGTLYQQQATQANIPFIVLSGSGETLTASTLHPYGIAAPLYFADAKTLYTMIRANPGLMLLYNATVVAKWSAHDIPALPKIERLLAQDWEVVSATSRMTELLRISLSTILLLILLSALRLLFKHVSRPS